MYATWQLGAGVNLFTLARRMGTSLDQIEKTYGHLAPDQDEAEIELMDEYDDGFRKKAAARAQVVAIAPD